MTDSDISKEALLLDYIAEFEALYPNITIEAASQGGYDDLRNKTILAISAGDTPTVVDTIYGKIGVAICYDIRFPELARYMVKKGAQMLIYPAAFNMTTGPAHWELLFRSRAVDNQVFAVGCAPARNYDSSYISYGHSIVVNPWGDVIGELNEDEGFMIGTINFEEVSRIREQLPLLKHLKSEKYASN